MREIVSVFLLIATSAITEAKPTTDNQKYLDDARQSVTAFKTEGEPERLREAYMALGNVRISAESAPTIRNQLRRECLLEWLHLVDLLDRSLDPNFNPRNVPARLVQPPPTKAGIVYPPGTDPSRIDDPHDRAEYQKAIETNRKEIERYRLQIHLSRLNEELPHRAESFIRNSYTSSDGDQKELRDAIENIVTNSRRKAGLLKHLEKSGQ